MIIALASPRVASSIDEGLAKVERYQSEAAAKGAEIVCFPEAYLPGLRGQDFEVPPETVRWAAVRGAKIVFHPQHTGAETQGIRLTQWGAADAPYYEKAMMMRSRGE
jgi:predicted amidohydrolase